MLTGGDTFDQGAPLVDAGQLVFGIDWRVSSRTHRKSTSETNHLIAEAQFSTLEGDWAGGLATLRVPVRGRLRYKITNYLDRFLR